MNQVTAPKPDALRRLLELGALAPGGDFRDVNLTVERSPAGIQSVDFTSNIDGASPFTFTLRPEDGKRTFKGESADGGHPLLASLGQWSLTRAYRHGATLVVANLQYSGIIFSALYGAWLFGDQIPLIGWAGMALVIASGIAATALRNRTLPQAPAEEH